MYPIKYITSSLKVVALPVDKIYDDYTQRMIQPVLQFNTKNDAKWITFYPIEYVDHLTAARDNEDNTLQMSVVQMMEACLEARPKVDQLYAVHEYNSIWWKVARTVDSWINKNSSCPAL